MVLQRLLVDFLFDLRFHTRGALVGIGDDAALELVAVVRRVFAQHFDLFGLARAVLNDRDFGPCAVAFDHLDLSDDHDAIVVHELPTDGETDWHYPQASAAHDARHGQPAVAPAHPPTDAAPPASHGLRERVGGIH